MSETANFLAVVKEEKYDFDEDVKFETPKRGRSRSLSKKASDKVDIRAKLERSRQSARECRARKKLRYQYLEEIIAESEKAIFTLRRELEMMRIWGRELDEGKIHDNLMQYRHSCEEKKLKNPFQFHAHTFTEEQKRQLQINTGGICISPTSSGLSMSPSTGQMIGSYMNMSLSQSVSPP